MENKGRAKSVGEAGGWLVIVNKSLAQSELHHLLSTHKFRLRGELYDKIYLCEI